MAHACVVLRRMIHGGRTLRVGYVEAVAVRADRRRAGYGRCRDERPPPVRARWLRHRGARREQGPAVCTRRSVGSRGVAARSRCTPGGVVRTEEEDDAIRVLVGGEPVDLDGDLTCDWREGDLW